MKRVQSQTFILQRFLRTIIKWFLFRFITLAVGILVALLIAECVIRLFKVEDYVQIVSARLEELGAECRFKASSNSLLRYEINNPPELPKEKPPDELRILCLGDSIIDNDWMAQRPVTFPLILERLLNLNLQPPYNSCTVVNSAVTGYNAVQCYEWYKKQWKDYQFDYVIFGYCCLNDRTEMRVIEEVDGELRCASGREYIPYLFQFPGQRYLLRFSKLYRLLNTRLTPYFEKRGRKIHEYTWDLVSATRSAIMGLRKLSEDSGARFILVVFPALRPESTEYNWIMNLLKQSGIFYLDLKPTFEAIGYNQLRFKIRGSWDNVHPNQLGHNIVVNLLAEEILQKDLQPLPPNKVLGDLPGNLLSLEGVVLNAASHNGEDENIYLLVDNNPKTHWHVSLDKLGEPTWVLIDFGEGNPKTVRSLYARPRKYIPMQFFRNAELFGSRDRITWEKVASIIQSECPNNNEWKKWSFDNARSYRYYKLMISDGYGDKSYRFYSMAELAMFE